MRVSKNGLSKTGYRSSKKGIDLRRRSLAEEAAAQEVMLALTRQEESEGPVDEPLDL